MIMRAAGLSKRFGATTAVREVELSLEKGEIVGLTGPDGAGKTTLLRLLTGVLPADSGQVALPTDGFGYMPQRFSLYGEMSVQENLRLWDS
jgi:ABC-2 type transport system ATP-binding protein